MSASERFAGFRRKVLKLRLGQAQFLKGGAIREHDIFGADLDVFDVVSEDVGKADAGGETDFVLGLGRFVVVPNRERHIFRKTPAVQEAGANDGVIGFESITLGEIEWLVAFGGGFH